MQELRSSKPCSHVAESTVSRNYLDWLLEYVEEALQGNPNISVRKRF